MQVHYINLEKRKDRNELFLKRNSRSADCVRVDAPEGNLLRMEDVLAARLITEPLKVYSLSVLANALSHKGLWQYAASTAMPLTIAEDDAILNGRFAEKAAQTVTKLPHDWDLILWGWNFDSILYCEVIPGLKNAFMTFDPLPLRSKTELFQAVDAESLPLRLFSAFGILCYSVSPKGARLLLNHCFPLRNELILVPGLKLPVENASLDVVMNKYYRLLKAYVSFPPLAWSDNDKETSDLHPLSAPSLKLNMVSMDLP